MKNVEFRNAFQIPDSKFLILKFEAEHETNRLPHVGDLVLWRRLELERVAGRLELRSSTCQRANGPGSGRGLVDRRRRQSAHRLAAKRDEPHEKERQEPEDPQEDSDGEPGESEIGRAHV